MLHPYFETLTRLLAEAKTPGWFPSVDIETLIFLRTEWYSEYPESQENLGTDNERIFTVPLAKLIAARLGGHPRFSADRDAFIHDWKYGVGMYYLWYLKEKYWQELARKERPYRITILGPPKQGTVIARFRRSTLYERQLWGLILAYADVPERFIR